MKRLLTFIFLVGIGIMANAQRVEGSLDALQNEVRVNFELNFANARIHGMTETDFAKYEEDWYKDMPQIVGDFLSELNNEMKGLMRFGTYPAATYTLKVDVVDVAANGSMDSDVSLLDNTGKVIAKLVGLQAEGAPWGTKLYLIKVGASNSGEKLGEILYKALKKKK